MSAKLRGNALRHIREARGLTLAQLALATGVKAARISQLEKRLPRIWNRLCRLADVLDCTVDEILGRPAGTHALVPVDVVTRQDRALLEAMRHDAEQLIGPQVLKLIGGWRGIARMGWLGLLMRARQNELARPTLPDAAAQQSVEDSTKRYRQIIAARAL